MKSWGNDILEIVTRGAVVVLGVGGREPLDACGMEALPELDGGVVTHGGVEGKWLDGRWRLQSTICTFFFSGYSRGARRTSGIE
jgi:hypothetical protein